jgi:hypothetical protein
MQQISEPFNMHSLPQTPPLTCPHAANKENSQNSLPNSQSKTIQKTKATQNTNQEVVLQQPAKFTQRKTKPKHPKKQNKKPKQQKIDK